VLFVSAYIKLIACIDTCFIVIVFQGDADAKAEFDAISALGPGNNKEEKKRVILRAWCAH
jgi:hypothetical protein